jgi:hypothetical protein
MPKHVLLKEPVTFAGSVVEADEVMELSDKSAEALVSEGKAVEVEPDEDTKKALEGPENDEDGQGTNTPTEDENDQQEEAGEEEKLFKALDDQYQDEQELKDAAKQIGVEVAWNSKKETIIKKVIEAGKGEVLLK